jgi:hypothetical protein
MVRVGGGWCALDEFLVKNDPCRGRNIIINYIIIFQMIKFSAVNPHSSWGGAGSGSVFKMQIPIPGLTENKRRMRVEGFNSCLEVRNGGLKC